MCLLRSASVRKKNAMGLIQEELRETERQRREKVYFSSYTQSEQWSHTNKD